MKRYWIVDILASDRVLEKLHSRGITLDEVHQAVAIDAYDAATWRHDPSRGDRLFVTGSTAGGKPLLVILGAVDTHEGIWHLRSAWINE